VAPDNQERPFASRAGLKLARALDHFDLDITNRVAADLGSSSGGFVDVLLRRGARKVYAVEKGFGTLDWRLRNDPRVVVHERTDACSVLPPELVDCITIDVGFTRQMFVLPHALTLLRRGGFILTLIKPQYEAGARDLDRGKLTDAVGEKVVQRVVTELASEGIILSDIQPSSVRGKDADALEYFAILYAPVCPVRDVASF
jgi:23S rRNA (cytidine1920-2'-O)/16S rRNA (cytidine1409-2'-O)-methyltransferase